MHGCVMCVFECRLGIYATSRSNVGYIIQAYIYSVLQLWAMAAVTFA